MFDRAQVSFGSFVEEAAQRGLLHDAISTLEIQERSGSGSDQDAEGDEHLILGEVLGGQ